jgi:hypothetical protein
MAAYDGAVIVLPAPASSNNVFNVRNAGDALSAQALYSANAKHDVRQAGVVLLNTAIKRNFRKRAWRTESAAYVSWDTVFESDPYPDGGTLDPPLGVVVARL